MCAMSLALGQTATFCHQRMLWVITSARCVWSPVQAVSDHQCMLCAITSAHCVWSPVQAVCDHQCTLHVITSARCVWKVTDTGQCSTPGVINNYSTTDREEHEWQLKVRADQGTVAAEHSHSLLYDVAASCLTTTPLDTSEANSATHLHQRRMIHMQRHTFVSTSQIYDTVVKL